MKKFCIIVGIFIILIIGVYFMLPNRVAVLGYHGVTSSDTSNNDMQLPLKKFEKQMKYLKKHHYKTLTLDEMNCYMEGKCKIPRKTVLLTFDDGYYNNYENVFPILKKYGFNGVVFVIGKNAKKEKDGFLTIEDIEKTKKEYTNIEFASHSYNLHYHEAMQLSYEDYIKDFKKQSKILDTKYYAYPYGDYNDDMIKALKENNFKLAFGFGPGKEFKKASNKDSKYVVPRLCINASMPMWKYIVRLLMPF